MSRRTPTMYLDTNKKPGDADCVRTPEDILAENERLKAEIERLQQPGNVAALREFAEYLANYPTCEGCEGKKDSRICESCPKGVALAPVALRARMALAEPTRNCDIMDASAIKVIFAERIDVNLQCLTDSARELAKNIAVAVVDTLYAPNAPAEEGGAE